jgi:hypothetical protein
MTQVRKTYLLHKSLTPGAAKQQNSMIIVKTTIITINVATPWLFVFAVAEDLLDGELIAETKNVNYFNRIVSLHY